MAHVPLHPLRGSIASNTLAITDSLSSSNFVNNKIITGGQINRETELCLILSHLDVRIESQVDQQLSLLYREREWIEHTVGHQPEDWYSYGDFQINSTKWCSRRHWKYLEDFANDDIKDDIECVKQIQSVEGLKVWDGWMKKRKKLLA